MSTLVDTLQGKATPRHTRRRSEGAQMSDESPSPAGTAMTATAPDPAQHGVVGGLSRLDRFLPVWIGLAMVAGLLLGRWVPGIAEALDAVTIGSVSLPIAVGLLVMMYPVLAK